MDKRVNKLLKAATDMKNGHYHIKVKIEGKDEVAQLAQVLNELCAIVDQKFQECQTLSSVAAKINSGLVLEEVLNYTFESFRPIIPYDRIGVALLEDDTKILRAYWARSDFKKVVLTKGYSSKMKGSSLQKILKSCKPRIINDLKAYLKENPQSESTKKVVAEGVRSSLTCPLIVMGKPIGFIFFSSRKIGAYEDLHVELFLQIASQLSMIVEKSRLYQQMLEINDLKNKLLGIAMHDLRSPISMINSRLDLIMDGFLGTLTTEQVNSLKGIRTWSERMLILIEELLDVSAIESGKLNLKEKKVDLNNFLNKTIELNQPLAEAKAIQLKKDFVSALPKVVFDPDRIGQVMNNLIGNAIKYSPKKTAVSIGAKKIRHEIQISVTDQGKGILKGEMDKVFEFFAKGSGRVSGGESSTGLGLAISKRMVEAHGGRIWVKSGRSKGSTFLFSLPLK